MQLARTNLQDAGCIKVAASLQSSSISRLYLAHNAIRTEGARAVAVLLSSSTSITFLNLSGNAIGVHGARAIADAIIYKSHLKELMLDECSLGDEGMDALQAVVSNQQSGLVTISLWKNRISMDGQRRVGVALQGHKSLNTVDFPQPVINSSLQDPHSVNRG